MINLKINKLSIHYNQPLLDMVDLYQPGNGVVALIGDNGSGKSTLLKVLSGREQQLTGEIVWSGDPRVGYMEQELEEESTLSGGQKKLMVLANLIYGSQYDVLLLDEPDNHLDLEGKEWLETAMADFDGLIIVISHDREFLENVSNYVWLVEDRTVRTYPFGFAKFQQEYANEYQAAAKLYRLQKREEKRLEELAKQFHAWSKDKAYRHTLKRLEQHKAEMVADPERNKARIALSAGQQGRQIRGKTALLIKDLCFRYPDQMIFDNANLHLEINEKMALVSPNGSGKSTLIKLLLNKLKSTSGTAKIGPNLKVGYYSQDHQEQLNGQETALSVLMDRYPLHEYQAEGILRKFLFTKQTMRSKIELLSGGQKARLQLAIFLQTNPQVLILDEPTNHLDLKSIAALENFLRDFGGAVLLISHDRQLVKNLNMDIYNIEAGKLILQK